MAINSVVIRYLPYDINNVDGEMGVARHDQGGSYASAFYPGNEAHTAVGYFNGVSLSAVNMYSAGMTGAVREWPFVLLAADGVSVWPIDRNTTSVKVGFGQCYAGGVIEIGAYIDGAYALLGFGSFYGLNPDLDHYNYSGLIDVALIWPLPPAFWTALKDSIETS